MAEKQSLKRVSNKVELQCATSLERGLRPLPNPKPLFGRGRKPRRANLFETRFHQRPSARR